MYLKKFVRLLLVLLAASVALNVYLVIDSMKTVNEEVEETTPPTSELITWERAVELIEACQVESLSQTHDLQVLIQTKTGDSYAAIEPEIDEVFKVVDASECEDRPVLITE